MIDGHQIAFLVLEASASRSHEDHLVHNGGKG
jgi:hypothetical protein